MDAYHEEASADGQIGGGRTSGTNTGIVADFQLDYYRAATKYT